MMIAFMNHVSVQAKEEIIKHAESGTKFDLKELFGKLSMDTIASCAFGVDVGSFSANKNDMFLENAKNVFMM